MNLVHLLPTLVSLASICLMAVSGLSLLFRLIDRARGKGALAIRQWTALPNGRQIALVLLIALLSRLVLFLWAELLLKILEPGPGTAASDFTHLWLHWDARHYLGIARDGYTNEGDARLRLVFFPLYPWLVRALSPLTGGNLVFAGSLLSVLTGCGAAVLLYITALNILPDAHLPVFLFLLNPMSVFFCTQYTEGLFLFLTLGALVLRRFSHPWLSALCGLLSALTRMPGILIAGIILIDLLEDGFAGTLTPSGLLRGLLQMLLVFSGLFLYWALNARVTGDPFTYLVYQKENWFQSPGTFWNSVENTVRYFLTTADASDHWWTWGAQLIAIILCMVLLILSRNLPFDLMAYSFVYMVVVLSPTWLLSAPRYLFGMFTLPLLEAYVLGRIPRPLRILLLSLSGALLLFHVYGFTLAVEVF